MIKRRPVVCKDGLCKLTKMNATQEVEPVSSGSSTLTVIPRRSIKRKPTQKRRGRKVIKGATGRKRHLVRHCPCMDKGRNRWKLYSRYNE